MTRRLLPLLLLLLALSGCSLSDRGATETSAGTATTAGATTTTEDPAAAATLAQVEALIPVTERLRGLDFIEPPNIVVVTPDELEVRVRDLIADELDTDELARDQATLELLGVLPPGTSLETLYLDLYGEQVGGFYDLETQELVVPASSAELSVKDRVVIVHELVHALTDQHFGHGVDGLDLADEERFDEHTALAAVVEGDAVRIESAYIRTLGPTEIEQLLAEYEGVDSSVFDAAPHYIQESLIWAYLEGFAFMEDLGGTNDSADDVYGAVPVSTEQVADPDRYRLGEAPIAVTIDTMVPAGYEIGESSTWGYASLEALLGAEVAPGPLAAAIDGWGGDRYRILFDGTSAIFQLHYVGDSQDDLRELAEALETYFTARIEEGDAWRLRTDGTTLVAITGDDPEAVNAIVDDLGFDTIDSLPPPPTTTTTEG